MAPELNFGTGGLRGLMGEGPGCVNRGAIVRATRGLAAWLGDKRSAGVAVVHDTRHHSEEFARAAVDVLAECGAPAYLAQEPAPTPLVSFAVRRMGLDAGIAITASHNPPAYNGFKVYGPDGAQIGAAAAEEIAFAMRAADGSAPPRSGAVMSVPEEVIREYVGCAVSLYEGSAPLRVVYSPLHGAGRALVMRALGALPGVTAMEVPVQSEPDGDFPTCPEPNPERPEALRLAIETAVRMNADIALATDPDCDRATVAFRGASGGFRALTGNEAGALLMEARLARWRGPVPPVVIKTAVTTDMANLIAGRFGAEIHTVPTGFKHIGAVLGRMEEEGALERFAFAFEESCGYLADPRVRDKDGLQAVVLLSGLAAEMKRAGRTIDQAIEDLGERYGHIADAQRTYPSPDARAALAALKKNPPHILLGGKAAREDGPAGFVLSGDGFSVILRASGTEPLLKTYLSARGASAAEAKEMLRELDAEIARWVEGTLKHQ